jgi:transposase
MPQSKVQHFADFVNENVYVGLDIHKRSWAVTIRAFNLQVAHFTQPPSPENLVAFLKRNYPGGNYFSVYEAGFSGTTIHENLTQLGVRNIIVNPGDIPTTDKQKKNKTDIHDSRALAEYLERGTLKGIFIHSRQHQELRALFRLRTFKSRDLTRSINKLKGFLMYFGYVTEQTWGHSSPLTKRTLAWLESLKMTTAAGNLALNEYIQDIFYKRGRLLQTTKQLRTLIQSSYSPTYDFLISVPGIGPIVAMALLSEIGDFNRFDDPDQYCSFLGLMPWECSSGETTRTKGVQPRCNHYLRSLIIEASWAAIRKAPNWLIYYRKHALKNNKRAIVKVARKLALTARSVVLKQIYYDPIWYSKLPNMNTTKSTIAD